MNSHRRTIAFGLTLMASVAFAGGNDASADLFTCSNRTIKGAFGTNLTGFVSPDGFSQVPLTQVGLFDLDGVGGFTGRDTASIGGQILQREFTGSYAVAPDCTLSATVTNTADGAVSHFAGVVLDGGTGAYLISTDPFTTFSGRAERVTPHF